MERKPLGGVSRPEAALVADCLRGDPEGHSLQDTLGQLHVLHGDESLQLLQAVHVLDLTDELDTGGHRRADKGSPGRAGPGPAQPAKSPMLACNPPATARL